MNEKILFVDDDKNLLNALVRNLRRRFEMVTAESGFKGLEKIQHEGPFSVVVSDLSMPGMNGIEFLKKVQEVAPESIRIMLTGNADLEIAINAVNEGQIFRFLTKPCRADALSTVLETAIEHKKLMMAEKELLEKTLHGSIKLMSELLSLINPLAFSRIGRIANIVKHIGTTLKLTSLWQYEMAALLSQIGYITLDSAILQKVNNDMDLDEEEKLQYHTYKKISQGLIEKIPRMELIADMIGKEMKLDINTHKTAKISNFNNVELGSMLITAAKDFEMFLSMNLPKKEAIEKMSWNHDRYPLFLLRSLESFSSDETEGKILELSSKDLEPGMIIVKPVFTKDGIFLANKGQEITKVMIMRFKAFENTTGLKELVSVISRRKDEK